MCRSAVRAVRLQPTASGVSGRHIAVLARLRIACERVAAAVRRNVGTVRAGCTFGGVCLESSGAVLVRRPVWRRLHAAGAPVRVVRNPVRGGLKALFRRGYATRKGPHLDAGLFVSFHESMLSGNHAPPLPVVPVRLPERFLFLRKVRRYRIYPVSSITINSVPERKTHKLEMMLPNRFA